MLPWLNEGVEGNLFLVFRRGPKTSMSGSLSRMASLWQVHAGLQAALSNGDKLSALTASRKHPVQASFRECRAGTCGLTVEVLQNVEDRHVLHAMPLSHRFPGGASRRREMPGRVRLGAWLVSWRG